MHWIKEENYAEIMRTEVEPFIAERRQTGFDERIPGQPIYYECFTPNGDPKGAIVLSHGFTESVQKFTESIYYMLQKGYTVWGIDHRGHGRSFRHNSNPYVVHVEHFKDYVLDLQHLVQTRVKPETGARPVLLYCHSMGGCIGAWLIEDDPSLFSKAVLSSPMLGLSFSIPTPLLYAGASFMGRGGRKVNPMKPVSSFIQEEFENSCDSSKCRFLYYRSKRLADRALQTTSPSIGWGKEAVKACARVTSFSHASRISIPVLLLQAGNDTVVKNAAQDLFASRVKNCKLYNVPGMKHELYMTDSPVLIPYWEKVFSFFEE